MELKTLKDIPLELKFTGREVREIGLRFSDMKKVEFIQKERDKQIRQESIKWVKKIKKTMTEKEPVHKDERVRIEFPDGGFMEAEPVIWLGIASFIIRVCNITEEDLNGQV